MQFTLTGNGMSKRTITGWILLLVILLVAAGALAQPQIRKSQFASVNESMQDLRPGMPYEPATVAMELKRVAEGVYYVEGPAGTPVENQGFMSNAGFVVTSAGVVVFDALGTPSLADRLLREIRQVTDRPIAKVVISHYHADHVYGVQIFRDQGAEVIAPMGAAAYLRSEGAIARLRERRQSLFPWVDENTRLVEPDVFVERSHRFELGGVTFQIDALGATHSEGDLIMRVEPQGVLFAGDLIFDGRIPFAAGASIEHWLELLEQLDAKQLKVVIPGHGRVTHTPQTAIHFTRDYLRYIYQAMKVGVDDLMTFEETYQQTDWSRYEKVPAFAANRVNANYVFLRLEASSFQGK